MKVPSGWRRENIGRLFEVQLGKMLSKKAKTGRQFPYLANFNIRWGRIDFSRMNKMAFSAREQNKYALQLGDLLVCEGGEVGRCAIWQGGEEEIYYQKALHRVRSTSGDASTEYLYFYLQFTASRGRLISFVGETSIAHLTREKLIVLPLLFPPLPEQEAIADLLSTWDEAIEKTEKLIEAKEKRFKWLLNELIGKPAVEGRVGWRKTFLGEVLTESRILDTENNSKKRISVRLHLKGVEIREYRGTEVDGATKYFKRRAGQFIYEKQNVFRGSLGIVPESLDGYCSTQDIPSFDIASDVDSMWLYFYFSRQHFYKQLESITTGTGSKRLNPSELYKIKISLPTIKSQKIIAAVITTAKEEIDLMKKMAERYRSQKRGLMQKLLTGEWRVKLEGA